MLSNQARRRKAAAGEGAGDGGDFPAHIMSVAAATSTSAVRVTSEPTATTIDASKSSSARREAQVVAAAAAAVAVATPVKRKIAIATITTATATTTTTATITTTTTTAHRLTATRPPSTSRVTARCAENKCSREQRTTVSNQRAVVEQQRSRSDDNTTSTNRQAEQVTWTWTRRSHEHRCEPLERLSARDSRVHTGHGAGTRPRLRSLAEHKAKLRSDFFGQRPPSESARISVSNQRQSRLQPAPIAAKQRSTVAQRQLELQEQFAQQLSIKRSASPTPPASPVDVGESRVDQLVRKFDASGRVMIVKKLAEGGDRSANMLAVKPDPLLEQRNSPLSDEGFTVGQSPYSSDNEEQESAGGSTATKSAQRSRRKEKVARSASSDSALGLDLVEDAMDVSTGAAAAASAAALTSGQQQQQQQRRMTLTVTDLPLRPALLPLAEPTALLESPNAELHQTLQNLLTQTTVPSKVLLEERVVPLQIDADARATTAGGGGLCSPLSSSRRESAQSCGSEFTAGDCYGVRYVRTPSVVVSDYSDDVMCGITLEEIEYFRAHRMRGRRSSLEATAAEKEAGDGHSDVSASSSCSNLYYCGSTISALDGAECYVNGAPAQLKRKTSDCSSCSASGEEEDHAFAIPEDPAAGQAAATGGDLVDMLAAQHLSSKRANKVGSPSASPAGDVGGDVVLVTLRVPDTESGQPQT